MTANFDSQDQHLMPDTSPTPKWISSTEAARRLNVSRIRVLKFIGEGRLHAKKLGRDLLLDAEEVENFVRKHPGRPRLNSLKDEEAQTRVKDKREKKEPADTDWLTSEEASVELGVSRRQVLSLIAQGQLQAEKIGREYLIHRSKLDSVKGKSIRKPRLTEDQVHQIQARRKNGESVADLARAFGTTEVTVYRHTKPK